MTRALFRRLAAPLEFTLRGTAATVTAAVRETAAGLDWRGTGHAFIEIDGRPIRCRVTVTVTPDGARTWPDR